MRFDARVLTGKISEFLNQVDGDILTSALWLHDPRLTRRLLFHLPLDKGVPGRIAESLLQQLTTHDAENQLTFG